jgi:hypothetical protein
VRLTRQRSERRGSRAPPAPQEPDDFEEQVAQALFDLEATNSELKADLRDLYITGAKEVDVQGGSRKAIIVHVSGSPAPGRGRVWGGRRGARL